MNSTYHHSAQHTTMLHTTTLRFVTIMLLAFGTSQAFPQSNSAPNSDTTTIRLTNDVLVSKTTPMGINLGGDAYYSGAALVKLRAHENFEGTMYRRCDFGPGYDAGGVTTWFSPSESWRGLIVGSKYTILSGPSQWTSGIVRGIGSREYKHQGRMKPFDYFRLDKPIKTTEDRSVVGIMFERDRTRDGQLRPQDGYWCSKNNEIAVGDVPPGVFGCAALNLKGTSEKAHYRFATHYQRYGETNGTWRIRFWAKRSAGTPRLLIRADRHWGEQRELTPQAQWTKYDETLIVDKVPEPKDAKDNPHLLFVFEATGGDILIDNVEIYLEGDTNPTAFRDDVVRMLERYKPGVIRKLQMGGNTIENTIRPPLDSFAYCSQPGAKVGPYENHTQDPYGLHEMYELCEYLKCDPWYCLPGTVSQDEIKMFMEYLGAPANVGGGKLRAQLGHAQPWTEVFRKIHVEMGNEAWNNAGPYQCGGFNGEDYWTSLFDTARSSSYFKPHIVFHAGGQAANSWLNARILKTCPNADCLTLAPYIIQGFDKEEYQQHYNTPEKLFRWAFAWPVYRSSNASGAMFQNAAAAKAAGIELSVYEINHHTTHGTGPLQPRNDLVTSIGGGLNVLNTMLMMLKEHGVRTQGLFSLVQHGYRAHNVGTVRLWGTALCMRAGNERFRPTFLACEAANKVIGGDLVKTIHEGSDPTFSATGVFSRGAGVETIDKVPTIWSYGFREGTRRGLVLINLDVQSPHNVRIAYDGSTVASKADTWTMVADQITANNEYEVDEPQVTVHKATVSNFKNGYTMRVPPFSMIALTWQIEP